MSAVTLTPRALYEEVAELLRQRIFQRALEPGSWIDEMKLAEEYGISRTVMKLNRHNSLLKAGRIDESLAEHRAIMAALLARDGEAAIARMQDHFKSGLEAAVES